MLSEGYKYLFTHPPLDSVVGAVVNARERQGQQGLTPQAKDTKTLDLFGRKIYSTKGLQLCITNQQVILNCHNFKLWDTMPKFSDLFLVDSKSEFSALVDEGKAMARTSLQAMLDSADSATCAMSSGITMRQHSWLHALGLPTEVQQTIQDFPFEGAMLLSEKTDLKLHSLKDSRATRRSLGVHTAATQHRHFRPQAMPQPYQGQPRQGTTIAGR